MDDLEKLERDIKRMEKFPTRYLSAAVKKGAQRVLLVTQINAPVDTSKLLRALTLKAEKSKPGKRVQQITYDDETLAKMSKAGVRSFYPASQEYGWIMENGQKHEGTHFMRDSADATAGTFSDIVIDGMMAKIEKAWRD